MNIQIYLLVSGPEGDKLSGHLNQITYRSGTVNSKSFVGKLLLRIKRNLELTVLELTVPDLYIFLSKMHDIKFIMKAYKSFRHTILLPCRSSSIKYTLYMLSSNHIQEDNLFSKKYSNIQSKIQLQQPITQQL